MDFKSFFIKQVVLSYFIIVACVTGCMAIMGMTFAPQTRFGYEAFISPFLFGLLGVLPSMITYAKKELSEKQMLFRLILQWLLLELMIVGFAAWQGLLTRPAITISFIVVVLLVDALVHVLMWLNEKRTAQEINQALKKMQQDT